MPAVVVIGAKNLGGAILDEFIAQGWDAAGIARSDETLAKIKERGAVAIAADSSDPESLAKALAEARGQLGGLDAIVNAASSSKPVPGEPFGGGPIIEANEDRWQSWGVAPSAMALTFLSQGARALKEAGGGGALVQIANTLSRRPRPGEGIWAAGQQGLRALVNAAAEELREDGIRVSLVIVDAHIYSPKSAPMAEKLGTPIEAMADQGAIAEAVRFAATRDPRGHVYEVVVSAQGMPWVA